MTDLPPPYSSLFDLASLSERGVELSLSPDAAERARIADWLGAIEVPRLTATVRLAHMDGDLYRYDAKFLAEVGQACVVTLEPVPSAHTGTATRLYRVTPRPSRRSKRPAEVDIELSEDDDAPEVLEGSVLDVAAAVLEELSLKLDPYPRAPGVKFEAPKDEPEAKESPFAVLAKLKPSPQGKPKSRK